MLLITESPTSEKKTEFKYDKVKQILEQKAATNFVSEKLVWVARKVC